MAKSLKQEVKECAERWEEKIRNAPPEHKEKFKVTARNCLAPYLDSCNMKRWQGRQVSDMIWDAINYIERM